jgi:hypothetical protein
MLYRTLAAPALSAVLLALPASTFGQSAVPPGGAPAIGAAPSISATPGSPIGSVGTPQSGAAPMVGTPPSLFSPTTPSQPSFIGGPSTPTPGVAGTPPSLFGAPFDSGFGGASTGATIAPPQPSVSQPPSITGPSSCPIGVAVC